jgi:hypothetical protein
MFFYEIPCGGMVPGGVDPHPDNLVSLDVEGGLVEAFPVDLDRGFVYGNCFPDLGLHPYFSPSP